METLRVYFADFWKSFDMQNNFFWNLLSEKYQLILDPVNPEVLFYSFLGYKDIRKRSFHQYKCLRIFYTGENLIPDYRDCDYSLSFELNDNPKNLRLPLYVLYNDYQNLINRNIPENLFESKSKFCCFVVSNPGNPVRNNFFKTLSKYKQVDSGGRFLNNIGGPVTDKSQFIKDYKFVLAFENESHPGYVTEKIYEPKLVDSVPVYWGDPGVEREFNPESFINCHQYSCLEEVLEKIIALDNNEEEYMKFVKAPFFYNDVPNEFTSKERILNFLIPVLNQRNELKPVGRTWKRHLSVYRTPIAYTRLYSKILKEKINGR